MAYIDVIPLADAKVYLRIDDTLTEDDAQITRMINASLKYVEGFTNVLVYARDKEYLFDDCKVNVYDFPINTTTLPTDVESKRKALLTQYTTTDTDLEDITLNVGYTDPADVPSDLIEVAYEILGLLYEGKDGDVSNNLTTMSKMILQQEKRFV